IRPFIALGAMGGLAGCDGINARFGGEDGVPLAELDLTGDPPTSVALMGPDAVAISDGEEFAITVAGDDEVARRLRFALKEGSLGILRERDGGDRRDGVAIVRITMPAPRKLVLAGSGRMTSERLSGDAEVAI